MDALALLRLQMEWGADEALEEAPIDRRHAATATAVRPAPRPVTPAASVAASGVTAPSDGQAAADAAQTFAALRAAIAAFEGCALRTTASNLVFADGNPESGLLLIGDAPSAAEDRSGRAFDGPAGMYLERMLRSIGLDREAALLTPLIPWRPPGGRPPTPAEIAACLPFLHRLILLARPQRIVLFGALAARTILGAAPRRRTRTWLPATIPGLPEPLPALPISSPEALMTKPAGRRDAWADLRLLRRTIDGNPAGI